MGRTPRYRGGNAPGWITLGAAIGFVAVGALGEEIAAAACRTSGSCGPEPLGTLSFGLLAAIIVAAFAFSRATPVLGVVFAATFAVARTFEVTHAWWVDVAAAGFVATAMFVTWPRNHTLAGLAAAPVVAHKTVTTSARLLLVRPGWLLTSAVSAAVAIAGVAGYLLGRSNGMPEEWLLLSGLAGGLAFTLGWRSLDWSLRRRRFLARAQPTRRCVALPLRFEVLILSEDPADPVLIVRSSVWEEARLERLWAGAGPDGCRATLYGDPTAGRWAAVEVAGEVILAREPSWIEGRDEALHAAATLLRHLAAAVPDPDVADTIMRSAQRYAADIGEPNGTADVA